MDTKRRRKEGYKNERREVKTKRAKGLGRQTYRRDHLKLQRKKNTTKS